MNVKKFFLGIKIFIKNARRSHGKPDLDLETAKNVSYGEEKEMKLDVYRPNSEGLVSVVVYFHGDILANGVKEHRRGFCVRLADSGIAVINAEYCPPSRVGGFENALAKAEGVLVWLKDNAKTYGLDLNKVILAGDGAGTLFAFSLALKNNIDGVNIAAVMGFSGIYDIPELFSENVKYNLHYDIIEEMFGLNGRDGFTADETERIRATSLSRSIGVDYPPVFLAHSVSDDIACGQGARFSEALRAKGVPVWEFKAIYSPCKHNFQLEKNDCSEGLFLAETDFLRMISDGSAMRNEYIEV